MFTHWRTRGLFARLLYFWGEYRRLILLGAAAAGVFFLLRTFAPETRRSLVDSLSAQRGLLILLLSFGLLILSLPWSTGQRLDTWILILFNLRGHHPLWMDRLMWVLTQIGNGIVGILVCLAMYLSGNHQFAKQMFFGILTLWITVELVKVIVERSRPFLALQGIRVIGWREPGKSFPSGHTSQAFFMLTLISHHFAQGGLISAALYALAGLVGFTRVYVGAHYPRDVIGGAILGSVWATFSSLAGLYLSTGQF